MASSRIGVRILGPLLAIALCGGAIDAHADDAPAPATMTALTDGDGHYFFIDDSWMKTTLQSERARKANLQDGSPTQQRYSGFFYGTEKKLHWVHTTEKMGSVWRREAADSRFWDPHNPDSAVVWDGEGWAVDCSPGVPTRVGLVSVPNEERERMIRNAKFSNQIHFVWRPLTLLVDDELNYYYVDYDTTKRRNDVPTRIRLFVGSMGSMSKMDVVTSRWDNAGLSIVTKKGTLVVKSRFPKVRGLFPDKGQWRPKGKSALEIRDILENDTHPLSGIRAELVYRDLGIYSVSEYRTPCDANLLRHSVSPSSQPPRGDVPMRPSQGFLSKVHQKYQGRIAFSKKTIDRKVTGDGDFATSFELGDDIHMRAFLSDSLANQLAEKHLNPREPEKASTWFRWHVYVNPPHESQAQSRELLASRLLLADWSPGEVNVYYTTSFGQQMLPTGGGTTRNSVGLDRFPDFLRNLKRQLRPGENEIVVELLATGHATNHDPQAHDESATFWEVMAKGTFKLSATKEAIAKLQP